MCIDELYYVEGKITMEAVLEFVNNYFLLSFIMYLISYLSPKEQYRRYIQFFLGILMAVVLFRPILTWDFTPDKIKDAVEWEAISSEIEKIE